MRRSQKKQLHALAFQFRPRERPQRIASVAGQLRKYFRQICPRPSLPFSRRSNTGFSKPRMALENARQLQS